MSPPGDPRPLVGILGGMGPAATVDFYAKLIAATPADADQDHLRVMIWADPTVPDRSQALTAGGADPTPKLVEGARHLADAGAAFYVVACNGAHAYLPRVREQVDLDYLSLIEVTAERLGAMPGVRGAGVLATDATLSADLYQERLTMAGVRPLVPDAAAQQAVMHAVYAVKAGTLADADRRALVEVANELAHRGADVIVAACTEIPLAMSAEDAPRPLIDPAVLLAHRVVAEVAARTR